MISYSTKDTLSVILISYSGVNQKMQNITIENLYQTIGKNVAKYRKAKGLSQLDLSLQMGYKSVSIVSGAEICYKGKHFNLEHIVKISQLLEVEFCEFFKPISES